MIDHTMPNRMLFNWLLMRRHGGQFILHIDDTDAERNRPEALQPILDGFCWLGIPSLLPAGGHEAAGVGAVTITSTCRRP